ncbi:MAG: type II toxin-antitoxin system HipA family toxin [Pseudomonadota bacterium]
MIKKAFDIYVNTRSTNCIQAADCIIEEINGAPVRIGFRYRPAYVELKTAFAIDPGLLPLRSNEIILHCSGGMPGFLDDYLPDSWGKKILTRLAFFRNKQRLNTNRAIDLLSLMSGRHIGAICIVSQGEKPIYESGLPIEFLKHTEQIAQQVDDFSLEKLPSDELGLLYLANSGSGVGGARPKALIKDHQQEYLAKFNRLGQDVYNNARIELACSEMARIAGINISQGKVIEEVNGRDVLLQKRFDIDDKHRRHIISVNALLKDPDTQRDHGFHFCYEDIYHLMQKYSVSIQDDAEQLLRIMLFNRCINNVDDHERNFSFIYNDTGYCFAPAYDLVPITVHGQYHIAGFGSQPSPPSIRDVENFGKVFGLSKTRIKHCVDQLIHALDQWEQCAEDAGASEKDTIAVKKFFHS